MPPIVILHEDADQPALWLAERLAAAGRAVERFTGSDLARARQWYHRLGRAAQTGHPVSGAVSRSVSRIVFADGRTLGDVGASGVINRLHYLPQAMLARLGGEDGDYARQEFHALLLSLLTALPGPMFNRPTPQGLAGSWRHPSHWVAMAQAAGLPVVDWRQRASDDPLAAWQAQPQPGERLTFALQSRLVDPLGLDASMALDTAMAQACLALGRASGCGLLGIRLAPDAAGIWRFVGAEVTPDYSLGGDALVAALLEELPE